MYRKRGRWEWLINSGEYQDVMILDENFIGVKNESGQYGFISVGVPRDNTVKNG